MKNDTGATPEPPKQREACPAHPGKGPHKWNWMPGRLLEWSQCSTCGLERAWKKEGKS